MGLSHRILRKWDIIATGGEMIKVTLRIDRPMQPRDRPPGVWSRHDKNVFCAVYGVWKVRV